MNHHGCCLLPQTAFATAVVADWTAHTVTFCSWPSCFPPALISQGSSQRLVDTTDGFPADVLVWGCGPTYKRWPTSPSSSTPIEAGFVKNVALRPKEGGSGGAMQPIVPFGRIEMHIDYPLINDIDRDEASANV